jgi:hypothetical protein
VTASLLAKRTTRNFQRANLVSAVLRWSVKITGYFFMAVRLFSAASPKILNV